MNNLEFKLSELKFAGDDKAMSFKGYGAVFGNIDSYGDVISPGAFKDTLAAARKSGDWPAMLAQHGGFLGSDMTPIGVWTDMEEDGKGLKVEGKLAPTARGQELYSLMKMEPRPAINGLSIGYRAKEWSVRTKPDEPRRTLKSVELLEVSIVTMPANPKARITGVKAIDRDLRTAIKELGDAIALHQRHMDGDEPTTMASQKKMMRMMESAYEALTSAKPGGMKSIITIREFEDFLRDAGGFSNAQAKAIASHGFKAADPRDEDDAGIAAAIRRNIATLTQG